MKHLDEGTLQALADGELPAAERRAAEAHLAGCGACAGELAGLRADHSTLAAALARVDVAPPTAAAQMSLRRRRAAAASAWGGEARRALLRAAVLVLALGGVAAAAVPGSPLRVLIERAVAPVPVEAPKPVPAPPVSHAPAPAPAAGISILPDGGAVRVVLNGAAAGLRVHARVSDGDLVEVSAAGAAAGARFRTGPGRIEVLDAGAGEVRIALPRSARAAVVEVDGRVYVAKEGERLRVMGPVARSATARETEFRVQD
ncbi:MAG: hypothetical protein AVDCRST_MAG68-3099 [uncultured Gemmatimonadetes bacterium]|uniref:Putative zinc-finger domain-containing protein n=1 Tax=uncultured Gemmatimonadota bacterium TaxID=203437 RepID=A0A6J4LWU9_9BACT|nr:MAG: hypothetical protein AVDCRST_MAG68-3099 [uncultured Gemmatimonadota bacterium]